MGMGRYAATRFTPIPSLPLPLHPQGVGRSCKAAEAATTTLMGRELWLFLMKNGIKRVWQHRNAEVGGFTTRYNVHLLVYFELHADMLAAITREKQIKKWNRAWKIRLFESVNPDWRD